MTRVRVSCNSFVGSGNLHNYCEYVTQAKRDLHRHRQARKRLRRVTLRSAHAASCRNRLTYDPSRAATATIFAKQIYKPKITFHKITLSLISLKYYGVPVRSR